jgi:hypothetical protein
MPSEPILVRSSMARWPAFLVAALGLALIVLGIVTASVFLLLPLGILLGVGGLVAFVGAFVIEARRVRRLMWVKLEDRRFTVTDNVGERTFQDDDIVSMALKYKENFENGVLKSVTRTFRIWIVSQADQPESIEMVNTLRTGASDPLHGFLERVVHLLKERAQTDRTQGRSILGEKWVLQGKILLLRDPQRGEVECPLEEITAADYIDNKLKLWRRGQDEAFGDIPHDSANCHLLKVMLEDALSARPSEQAPEPPAGQLGRIIFERKPPRRLSIFLYLLGGLLSVLGLFLLAISFVPANLREAEGLRLGGGALFLLGGGLILGGAHTRRALFRCQAFGVYQRGLMAEKSLRYSEMETFNYSATRHYHNGVYTGTQLKMVFNPQQEFKHKKIVYSTTVKNVDSTLDEMRDQIAGMLAGRLIRAVNAGQSVEWTPNLTLTPEGLRYVPAGLFTKKTPELLPYRQISGHNLNQGTFAVFRQGKTKAAATEAASARNFFPGWLAFAALLNLAQQAPPGPEKASSPAPSEEESPDARA